MVANTPTVKIPDSKRQTLKKMEKFFHQKWFGPPVDELGYMKLDDKAAQRVALYFAFWNLGFRVWHLEFKFLYKLVFH